MERKNLVNKPLTSISGLVKSSVVAVALFFTGVSCSQKGSEAPQRVASVASNDSSAQTLPIAYVNVDTILANYNLAKDANENLMRKMESSSATVKEKQRRLQAEYTEFQRKVQTNAFLSEDRAKQEAQRLQNLEKEIANTAARLEEDLLRERQKLNDQLTDSVRNAIKAYNQKANFEMILSNSGMDNILFAKEKYDITADILKLLNDKYTSAKK